MRVISPGKFEVVIGGTPREITVSLGLKAELYKLITRAQLSMAQLGQNVPLNGELAARIQQQTEEVNTLKGAQAPTEEIDAAQAFLDRLFEEALRELEERQARLIEDVAIRKIELSEQIFTEAISLLLSERDARGQVVKKVTPEEVMWQHEYAEAQEELAEFLSAVTEYITSALKKVQRIREMVQGVTEK